VIFRGCIDCLGHLPFASENFNAHLVLFLKGNSLKLKLLTSATLVTNSLANIQVEAQSFDKTKFKTFPL
jgi:hypothetical protein